MMLAVSANGTEFAQAQMLRDRRWAMGLDLGKLQDYTAVAILESLPQFAGARFARDARGKEIREYRVRHLQRWPLGTSYHAIAQDVKALLMREPLRRESCTLVSDYTGVGVAVDETLRGAGLKPEPVMITSGLQASKDGRIHHVPKRDLIIGLREDWGLDRIGIARGIPDAKTLTEEVQTVELKQTTAGNEVFVHREGTHDDLVLAVALARWWLARPRGGVIVAW